MRRIAILALGLVLASLQYRLWVADGGIAHTYRLRQQVQTFATENAQLSQRNAALDAEVRDLGNGKAAIEARARIGLGMVRRGETFYLITQQES